ncbi:MAG: glycosyltransferase family 4 protein [Steroidobacteraceae bacterium]
MRRSVRLRVALVGEYPISEDAIQEGGVQSVTFALAHALARRTDIECHVVAAMREATTDYRQVGDLHIHYVRRFKLPRLVTLNFHEVPALTSVIRSIEPDVVHGEGQEMHSLAALRAGFPTVITPHGVGFIESRLLKRHRWDIVGSLKMTNINSMERKVFRNASDMIIISKYLTNVYGEMLTARTHFIENPIDPLFFNIQRAPEPGRLLFVGTVVPRKRIHDLVAALAIVQGSPEYGTASNSTWRESLQLRIAGPLNDPGSVELIRQAVESAGLQQRVIFLGPVSQAQLQDEYARAQLLLLASREETAPQVIAQAMACGLPTVASAVGGVPFMVKEGETGLLFPFSDTKACAEATLFLLRDDRLRHAMEVRAARLGQERFHPDSVAQQSAAVYREVLGRAKSPPA